MLRAQIYDFRAAGSVTVARDVLNLTIVNGDFIPSDWNAGHDRLCFDGLLVGSQLRPEQSKEMDDLRVFLIAFEVHLSDPLRHTNAEHELVKSVAVAISFALEKTASERVGPTRRIDDAPTPTSTALRDLAPIHIYGGIIPPELPRPAAAPLMLRSAYCGP